MTKHCANRPINVFCDLKAFRAGYTIDQVHELTKIDKWFLQKLMNIMKTSEEMHEWGNNHKQIADLPVELLRKAKVQGFSDFQIARAIGYEGDMEMEACMSASIVRLPVSFRW